MRRISDEQRRHRLVGRHRLTPGTRSGSVAEIADSVVALHSSDPVTVFLSIAARSDGLTIADVERALYEDRDVVRHHAMRRTLWVTTPSVGEFAHAACTRKIAATERSRSAKFVGDAAWFDAAVERVVECIRGSEHPIGTRQIGDMVPELRRNITYGAGTRHEATGSAHTRAVLVAAFDGAIVRTRPAGSWTGSQYAWTATDRWTTTGWDTHDEHTGATMLVGAWLERFGPGTLDDIVWWSGLTKGLVRRALDQLAVDPVDLDVGEGYVFAGDDATDDDPTPNAFLLPGLDPAAMGYKHREWYLDGDTSRRVKDRFGNVGPTVWADGRVVGGWAQRPDGSIAIEFTRVVSADHRDLIDLEAERLRAFIGDARFKVRFPSPNQPELLA